MGGKTGFDLEGHRRERARNLEREVCILRGERARLERLLAVLLVLACDGRDLEPLELLELLGQMLGMNLARASIFDVSTRG